jgi:4-amino-4-deoxy-L-arabinose transferase-like glycosyltransferase
VFLAARDRISWLFGAGALVGAAMLFKYQAGVQLPLFGMAWLVTRRRQPARAAVGLAAIALGAIVPIAAAAAVLALHGSLDAAWFWFRFNFAYIHEGSRDWAEMMVRAGFVVVAALPLYWLAARAIARRRGEPFGAFVLAWLAVSGAAVLVGGRFFGHYFHQLTAPLAVLAAPAAVAAWRARRRWFVAAVAVPAAVFLVLGAAHDRMMAAAGEPDPDYAAVVSWIDAHAQPGDALCVWGNSPVLYFEAARPLGCRFVFSNYLTGMSPATATQTDSEVDSSQNIVPVAWDMLEEDLSVRRPAWLVDGSPGDVAHYGKYPPAKFPRLAKRIACEYAPAAEVAGMRIYRRLAAPRCSSTALNP